MMDRLKFKLFPCSEKMAAAIKGNREAVDRLNVACSTHAKFPELKDGHIVNPR